MWASKMVRLVHGLWNHRRDPTTAEKISVGKPSTLRGFPQTIKLMYDHLALASLDFKFPLFHAPFWGDVSATNIQGVLFYDQERVGHPL